MLLLIFLYYTLDATLFESEEKRDFEAVFLELEELRKNPLDINTCSLEELLKIPFLKIPDALRIVAYREKSGPFENLEELNKVPALDTITILQIRPYLTIKRKPIKWKEIESRIRIRERLKEKESPEYYTRTKVRVSDYTIFLLTEKDPNESSFFDYYSAGILIEEGKRRFALGNYNLDFGSGVMLSSVGSLFQGIDFRMLTRERGIIPYTSTMENGGFFGAALSDSLFLNYSLFYSNQKLDGIVDSNGYAHSFYESGDHIDSLAQSRKDRIREEIIGYNIQYRNPSIIFSNKTYWSGYEPPFVCADSLTDFYGANYWITGLDIRYLAERFIIFGELTRSFQNRLGAILGGSGIMPFNFEFNLAAKYFSPGFYAPKGIESKKDYIGAIIDFNNHSRIINAGTSLNIYTNPEADTNRYDLKLNLTKVIGLVEFKSQLRWLFRSGIKELTSSRIFLKISPIKPLYFNLRLEEKYSYGDTLLRGIYGGVDIGLNTKSFELLLRLSAFESESYKTRLFIYEPDLPGVINNRMVYGKGEYGIIFVKFRPINYINISLKYSAMDRDSLSQQFGIQLDSNW